jgi:hypothetical protein
MAQTIQEAKVLVGDLSLTVFLTKDQLKGWKEGRFSLILTNDGQEPLLQSLTSTVLCGSNSATVSSRKTFSGGDRSEIKNSPVMKKTYSQALSASNSPVKGTPSVKKVAEKPTSDGGRQQKKQKVSDKAKYEERVRNVIEPRMKRIGAWEPSLSNKELLSRMDSSMRTAILKQTYVWKEFCIANRLPGYERSAENRDEAIRKDPNHLTTAARKLNKQASSNAGECVRQGTPSEPSQEDSSREEKPKALPTQEAEELKVGNVSDQERKAAETERSLSCDEEISTLSPSLLHDQPPLQEGATSTVAPASPSEGKGSRDPAKSRSTFPSPRGGRGGRSGRRTARSPIS